MKKKKRKEKEGRNKERGYLYSSECDDRAPDSSRLRIACDGASFDMAAAVLHTTDLAASGQRISREGLEEEWLVTKRN